MVARLLAVLLVVSAVPVAAPAARPPAAHAARPPAAPAASPAPAALAGARLLACRRSPSIEGRAAVVGTWMRPLPNGRRLAVKVDLWQRTPTVRWALRSDVPGLGTWVAPSDAQLGAHAGDVFKYRQSVGRLAVPAAYRFRVDFRWTNAAGVVVRESVTTTPACRQPDLRPDLVLLSVTATPARKPGLVRYAVLVGNEGRSSVARANVAATFPGETTPNLHQRHAGPLPPGATALVAFAGPGCAAGGQPAAFVADPANAVDEADEANNQLAGSCPAP